jgi:hypothetical protein
MAQLVEEHNDRQDEQERNRVADQAITQRIENIQKKVRHSIPLAGAMGSAPIP